MVEGVGTPEYDGVMTDMSDIRFEVVALDDDLGTMVVARDDKTGKILALGVDAPDGQTKANR